MGEMTSEDWKRLREAVQFREKCIKTAVERMEYRSQRIDEEAACTTFDAIVDLIRQDERSKLQEQGRLLPESSS